MLGGFNSLCLSKSSVANILFIGRYMFDYVEFFFLHFVKCSFLICLVFLMRQIFSNLDKVFK